MARSEPLPHHLNPAVAPQAESLTEIERKILDFMVQYLRANTYQPSIREIGRRFGIKSTKTVSEHLHALSEKGFLERDASRSRGVRILGVDLSPDAVSLPCFNEAPANRAAVSASQVSERMSIDRRLGGEEGAFFVRASPGDLAILGVEEGDLVLFSPTTAQAAEDGAIVLARTGGRTLFHRVRKNGRGLILESLGPAAERVLVEDPDQVVLLGRMAGFYRKLDETGPPAPTRH